jgi:rhodanese-related sulfurtransferase
MYEKRKIPLLLGAAALVLGATLAIAGSSSDRLQPERERQGRRGLATKNYIDGLRQHRFRVTAQTLRGWVSGPTPPLVVDVRHRAPYQAEHIPGALHREALSLLAGEVKLQAGKRQVVIYDQGGQLAPYLIHPLRSRGIDAYSLAGGYAAWVNPHARRPGERARPRPRAGEDAPRPSSRPAAPTAAMAPPMAPPPSAPPRDTGGPALAPPSDEGC